MSEEAPMELVTTADRGGGDGGRTGEHRFVLDPRDPLGTGFVLR